jgi:murein DD-endopeptidase MepM/ murein hydrolase activator NlpD
MLDARAKAVRRSFAVAAAAILMSLPTGAGAVAGAASASPTQEDRSDDATESADRALADVDAAVAGPDELAGVLDAHQANVSTQLEQLELAQAAIGQAESALADAQSVVQNTELRIEELQVRSDAVVVDAFVNSPVQEGVDVFSSSTMEDATIKQAILDVHAADSARTLADLEEQQAALEEQRAAQEAAVADANEARTDAEAALADLESAVSAQAQFVLDVEERLQSGAPGSDDPAVQAREAELQAAIGEAQEAAEFARAMEELAEAERRREEAGIWTCPVARDVSFSDTWGAARSGGRTHQGTDMMSPHGTPVVAPVSGTVEHRGTSLGGLSAYVYGDDGNTYYGTHLQSYENEGAGHVERGTVIGYVGSSGNASADAPHLHFEFHPGGGSPVNPYPRLVTACPGSAN